jgi:hypothetical protein
MISRPFCFMLFELICPENLEWNNQSYKFHSINPAIFKIDRNIVEFVFQVKRIIIVFGVMV